MEQTREDRIRARAHEIWEREGRPEGSDAQHWRQAESEIDAAEKAGDVGAQFLEAGKGGAAVSGASGAGGSTPGASTGGSGLASGLQPSGTAVSGSPAAGAGSLGTGGGSTAGKPSGGVNR